MGRIEAINTEKLTLLLSPFRVFQENDNPSKEQRLQLVRDLELDDEAVCTWFKNARRRKRRGRW